MIRIILLLSAALILTGLAYAEAPATQKIRIGYITDLTGRGAFFGVQSVRGAKLAQKELADTRSLEILYEDTNGDTAKAVSAATKLIDFDKVDAVICDLTPICSAITGKVSASNKPLIFHSPAISITKRSPYAYRNFLDYEEACRVLARKWKDGGYESAAVLAPNLEFGDLCVEGFSKVYSSPIAVRYNPGDDLRTPLLSLKTRGVRAVLHVGYEPDFLNWFKLCGEQQFSPLQGFSEFMLSPAIRAAVNNSQARTELIGYATIPESFVTRLDKAAPLADGDFNRQGAAIAYNAVSMLVRAFTACPAKNIECIDNSLRSPPGDKIIMGFRGWGTSEAPYHVELK